MRSLALLSALLLSGSCLSASATEFWLDPVNGLDTNSGTSPSQAWKSNAPVNNGHVFNGGDKLHIAGGSTLPCTIGTPNNSCLYIRGAGNLDNLPVNFIPMGGLPFTIDNNFNPQNGPYTLDLSGGPLQWGIVIVNADSDISGGIVKGGGAAQLGAYQNSAGIYLQPQAGGSVNATVTGMDISDFSVLIWSAQAGMATGKFTKNYLHGSSPTTMVDFGILMQGWQNSTVRGNIVENIGGRPNLQPPQGSGSGILISNGANNVLDEYNVVRNGGVNNNLCGNAYGNWTYNSAFIVIQHNEVSGQKRAGGCDGGGFNLDGGVRNSVLKFNYSHGNAGPGFATWMGTVDNSWGPNTIEDNISVGDAMGDPGNHGDGTTGGITFYSPDGNTKPVYVRRNTVWNTAPASGTRSAAIAAFQCPAAGSSIEDNLFISSSDMFGTAELVFMNQQTCPGALWTNNGYASLSGTSTWYQVNGPNNLTTLPQWQAVIPGGDVGAAIVDPNNLMDGICLQGIYGVCP